MGRVLCLKCRECGAEYPPTLKHICEECFGPLDVSYDYDNLNIRREDFLWRVKTLWRYKELLPLENPSLAVDLSAGFTPLHRSERLAEKLGLKELYLKNDTVNPTFSFKDRPSSVAVSKAKEFGLSAVGCASTGNLAAATAAHAARAGLPCYIFIPYDLEQAKIIQASSYGAHLVAVRGTYDDANKLAAQAADAYGIGVVNINVRPYYVEGSKTLGLEVAEQLDWKLPDHVIIPVASGALLCSICKGFEELRHVGLIDDLKVKVTAAQAEGCSPIVQAFKRGLYDVSPIENPLTVAKSLAIGDPGDGIYVLRSIRHYGGYAEAATDKEIIDSIKLLAKTEGIFTEPAGGVSISVLKRLVDSGRIDHDETVVCYITGNGLKTAEVLADHFPKPVVVENRLDALAPVIRR